MKYDYITAIVRRLQKKYLTSDPWELCGRLKIRILKESMGTSPGAVKGFFMRQSRIRMITINVDLPETVQRYILAHELGHALLHCNTPVRLFHDCALYDVSSVTEKEANLFAADLLMRDEEILSSFKSGNSFFDTARILNVPWEFLEFKLRIMRANGADLPRSPLTAGSKFLKNVQIPEECADPGES